MENLHPPLKVLRWNTWIGVGEVVGASNTTLTFYLIRYPPAPPPDHTPSCSHLPTHRIAEKDGKATPAKMCIFGGLDIVHGFKNTLWCLGITDGAAPNQIERMRWRHLAVASKSGAPKADFELDQPPVNRLLPLAALCC